MIFFFEISAVNSKHFGETCLKKRIRYLPIPTTPLKVCTMVNEAFFFPGIKTPSSSCFSRGLWRRNANRRIETDHLMGKYVILFGGGFFSPQKPEKYATISQSGLDYLPKKVGVKIFLKNL